KVRRLGEEGVERLPPRDPPIRFRKTVPTSWIEIMLTEGRNRQVRRMTAAIGHPTLRLVRVAIGELRLGELLPGQWREANPSEVGGVDPTGTGAAPPQAPPRPLITMPELTSRLFFPFQRAASRIRRG